MLCELFRITPEEIQARREFLGFSPEDEENLKQISLMIKDEADAIVAEFYDHLLKFEEPKRFVSDRRTLDRVKMAQREYLLSLGREADQLAYFEDRLRIGTAHERMGLQPKWYWGAYTKMFELVGGKLAARHVKEPEKLFGLMITLQKILALDSTLAVETYHQARTQRLESILQQMTEAQHNLQEISRLDGLTHISNRKVLVEALEMEVRRSLRFKRPFALLLIDIDHFKHVNDRHGHAFGDFVLQKTVHLIRSVVRPTDIIGRYGAEEFAVGLVETDEIAAQKVAERTRVKVALTPFELEQGSMNVTVSIGLAILGARTTQLEALIEKAARALDQAKTAGRNQVRMIRD
jgi:diguanylate cyclase (GGDEF)-like protein